MLQTFEHFTKLLHFLFSNVNFQDLLNQQKEKFHAHLNGTSGGGTAISKQSLLQVAFELVFVLMVAYFLVSLINSLAQSYDRRVYQREKALRETKQQ